MAAANAYNPFATALTMASRNPAIQSGIQNLFSPSAPPVGYDTSSYSAGGEFGLGGY